MPVCLFALQILWTRESRGTVKKIRAAIKAGLITLTRIIVMNVHGGKGVINQAQRQKIIASRLSLKHIKIRGPFRQLKHFKNIIKLRYRIDAKNAEVKTKHSYQ